MSVKVWFSNEERKEAVKSAQRLWVTDRPLDPKIEPQVYLGPINNLKKTQFQTRWTRRRARRAINWWVDIADQLSRFASNFKDIYVVEILTDCRIIEFFGLHGQWHWETLIQGTFNSAKLYLILKLFGEACKRIIFPSFGLDPKEVVGFANLIFPIRKKHTFFSGPR